MKFVPLITIALMLPLVSGNNKPCQTKADDNAYKKFVAKHIVQNKFNRDSKKEWQKYISKMGLCNKHTVCFFEKSDENSLINICNGHGHPLKDAKGYLCMSDAKMQFHKLVVDNNCKVTSLMTKEKKPILGCRKVGNKCRPVHYEENTDQHADMTAKPCKP